MIGIGMNNAFIIRIYRDVTVLNLDTVENDWRQAVFLITARRRVFYAR